jgi:hypothetical protein
MIELAFVLPGAVLIETGFSPFDPVFNMPFSRFLDQNTGRDCLIGLFDLTVYEKFSVEPSAAPVDREQDNSGGLPVYAVQRCQILNSGTASQAIEKTFVNISSPWCDRQKMRLAGHQQIIILKNHSLGKWYDRFCLDFAEVLIAILRSVFGFHLYRVCAIIEQFSFADPFFPGFHRDCRESGTQKSKYGRVRFFDLRHGNHGRVLGNSMNDSSSEDVEILIKFNIQLYKIVLSFGRCVSVVDSNMPATTMHHILTKTPVGGQVRNPAKSR